jgi:hypothetical protein
MKRRWPATGALVLAPVVVLLGCLALSAQTAQTAQTAHGPGATSDTSSAAYGGRAGTDHQPAPEATLVKPARRVGSVPPEQPTAVRLPSGAWVRVTGVSSDDEGTLAVPSDISVAGWWRGGSRVGDPFGSTLVAAHIDSTTQGLGPFAELLSLRPGARVLLTTEHLTQAFRVRALRLVPQGSLRGERWIFSARGPRRLTLVTCAPPYDRSRGGYQNLAVVVAVPAAHPQPRRTGR